MPINEKRLYGPVDLGGLDVDTYVVPANTTAKVYLLIFNNHDTASHFIVAGIRPSNTALTNPDTFIGNLAVTGFAIPPGPFSFWCDLTLKAAERIRAYADGSGVVSLTISGEERTLDG